MLFALKRFLVLCCLLSMASCTSLKHYLGFGYEKPTVALSGIQLLGMRDDAIQLKLLFKVENPNDFEVKLKSLEYQLLSPDAEIARGFVDSEIRFPAMKETMAEVPLSLQIATSLLFFTKILENPKREDFLRLKAIVLFDTPIGTIERTIDEKKPLKRILR